MNPHELAQRRVDLSAEYATDSARLGELKAFRAIRWLVLRKDCKTDKEADRTWEATSEGQEEMKLQYKTKGMEKEISALNTMLRVLDSEARNQY